MERLNIWMRYQMKTRSQRLYRPALHDSIVWSHHSIRILWLVCWPTFYWKLFDHKIAYWALKKVKKWCHFFSNGRSWWRLETPITPIMRIPWWVLSFSNRSPITVIHNHLDFVNFTDSVQKLKSNDSLHLKATQLDNKKLLENSKQYSQEAFEKNRV